MAAASVPTILKHYAVPLMPQTQTSGLVWWRKSQKSILRTIYRKVWFFPAKPMQKNIYDMSMCFTHGFNVGRFHLRRGCRPVCARLTTPPLCCGLFLQETFFKLCSPVWLDWMLSWTPLNQKQYHNTCGIVKVFFLKACVCVYTGNQSLTLWTYILISITLDLNCALKILDCA